MPVLSAEAASALPATVDWGAIRKQVAKERREAEADPNNLDLTREEQTVYSGILAVRSRSSIDSYRCV